MPDDCHILPDDRDDEHAEHADDRDVRPLTWEDVYQARIMMRRQAQRVANCNPSNLRGLLCAELSGMRVMYEQLTGSVFWEVYPDT